MTTNSNTGVAVGAVRKAETTRLSSLISCHGSVTSATRGLEKTCRYACTKGIQNFLPKKLRQGATGLTTNGQTLQKACNIDYGGTSSEAGDVSCRTDPLKDPHNVEQTQTSTGRHDQVAETGVLDMTHRPGLRNILHKGS